MAWRHLLSEIVNKRRAKFEDGCGSSFDSAEIPMLIPCPARSTDRDGVSGGRRCSIAVGIGSGPEGSRPTADVWRLRGCGAESGFAEETEYVLPTENASQSFESLMAKVTIIGATGQVGTYVAHSVSQFPHVQEMCLFGRSGNEQYLEGLAHDMTDSFAARGTDTRVTFGTNPEILRGSDIIVLTAGIPRKADQTRLDLALENARIVKKYAELIGSIVPDSLLLVVTNPVDIMTTVALKYSGMKPNQVFGLGTHLDSMRLKSRLAKFFKVHVSEVHTRIVGEHGDTMVPLWSATTIGGVQIDNLLGFAPVDRETMLEEVKNSGSQIIKAKGATVYGPGDAIASLIRTIVEDENRLLTVSTEIVWDSFSHKGICISVPARITRNGVYSVGIRMSEVESAAFIKSVELIRKTTEDVFSVLDKE